MIDSGGITFYHETGFLNRIDVKYKPALQVVGEISATCNEGKFY